MKKHPLIRELQLGKSVSDLVTDICNSGDYDFQLIGTVELDGFIKELVKENNPSFRFGVFTSSDSCNIDLVNGSWASTSPFYDIFPSYWDDDYNYAREDDAEIDCGLLNRLVVEILGPHKFEKKKVTKKQAVLGDGKVCPHCGRRERHTVLDEVTWKNRKVYGCKRCGETWRIIHKLVPIGLEK